MESDFATWIPISESLITLLFSVDRCSKPISAFI